MTTSRMRSSAKSVQLLPNKPCNKACSCQCQFCPTSLSSSPNCHPFLDSLSCSSLSCHFQHKTLWIGATPCTPNNPFYHIQPVAWTTLGTCKIHHLGQVMGWMVIFTTEAKGLDYITLSKQTFFISPSHVNAFKLLPISFVLALYNNALSNHL